MKARVPKSFQSLSTAQRKSIEDYAFTIAQEQLEKDGRIMLDLYIKMVCLTLNKAFGFGETRLGYFLADHVGLFRDQVRKVRSGEQIEYLDKEMARIFRKNGFPSRIFDKLLGPIERSEEVKG